VSASGIPARIAAYRRRCVPDPPPAPHGTLLEQRGRMRLAPDRRWLPFTAEQSVASDRTAFVWRARMTMAPLVRAVVEDAYEAGRGRLDAKVWGVLSVAHARGPEVDRGEAQRYLAELVWCPLALTANAELRYGQETDDSVRVWVNDEQTWVDLLFDGSGDIVGARTTTRARDGDGIRAPSRGEVWWETPEGRFVYWQGEVRSLRWDPGGPSRLAAR
jgi:hypothetical protein